MSYDNSMNCHETLDTRVSGFRWTTFQHPGGLKMRFLPDRGFFHSRAISFKLATVRILADSKYDSSSVMRISEQEYLPSIKLLLGILAACWCDYRKGPETLRWGIRGILCGLWNILAAWKLISDGSWNPKLKSTWNPISPLYEILDSNSVILPGGETLGSRVDWLLWKHF
jgi:hypothetical protein